MSDHITYGRAREIERVIKGSGVFIGTDEWLETEAITSEEFDAYFAYAAERASQLDWLDQHRDGQTEIVSTKASLEQISIKAAKTVMSVGERWQLQSLAASLGMTAPKCREFLEFLAESGCIDGEVLKTRGEVFDNAVWEQVQAYQTRCRANRANGKKGGFHT